MRRNPQTLTSYDLSRKTPAAANFWVPYDRQIYPVDTLLRQKDAQVTAAHVINCSKPQPTTTGTTGTAPAAPLPLPQIPPAPPALDLPSVPKLPTFFCSVQERYDYLVQVLDPLITKADDQGRAWADYRDALRKIAQTHPGDAAFQQDLAKRIADAENNEYRASRAARALDRARSRIYRTPLHDCGQKSEQPKATVGPGGQGAPVKAPATGTAPPTGAPPEPKTSHGSGAQPKPGIPEQPHKQTGRSPSEDVTYPWEVAEQARDLLYCWLDDGELDYLDDVIIDDKDCVDRDARDDLLDVIDEMRARKETGLVVHHHGALVSIRPAAYSREVYERAIHEAEFYLDMLPPDCPCDTDVDMCGAFPQVYVPNRLFLGIEKPGALNPDLGLLHLSPRATGNSVGLSVYPSWGHLGRFQLGLGYNHTDVGADAFIRQIDPGLGKGLVLPGRMAAPSASATSSVAPSGASTPTSPDP